MSITISTCFPGHWERTYTTTTTVTSNNGVGFANSNTTASDSFRFGPNRLGQSGAKIIFYNEAKKDIKYVHFKVLAMNSVNDTIGMPITLKATGPIKKHSLSSNVWDYIWNNPTIRGVVILEVTIEYFDGSTEKQCPMPSPGEKKLNLDGSVGHTLRNPILLASTLVAGTILNNLWTGWGMSGLFSKSNVLAIVMAFLGIATIIFSRQMKNRRGTVACGTIMSVLGIIQSIAYLFKQINVLRFYRRMSESFTISCVEIVMQIGTILMLVLLLLAVFNSGKNYSKRKKMITTTVAWLCSCAGVIWIVAGVIISGGIIDAQVGTLGIDIALKMLLWGFVAAVANRCRCNYDIE